jgi:hypothetical protein
MEGLTGTLWRKMGNCQWSRKSSAEPNETIGLSLWLPFAEVFSPCEQRVGTDIHAE